MSKEQINYLLALATLIVVWLYFNTFFCGAKRTYMGPMGGMTPASVQRFPNTMVMQPGGMQNIQQPPNITELLKNQARALQRTAVPSQGIPSAASETPQKDKTR